MSTKAKPKPVVETPVERRERKIAIVGFTPSRDDAPWDDPTFEKWLCNNLWKYVPEGKWDRLYDLHEHHNIIKDAEHTAYLARCDKPVYVFEPQPEWPTSVAFPKEPILDTLGRYFTNSISWMIAHALMEGVTELHIYGVDLAQGTEYCISPDSRVLTQDLRWVRADEIVEGDRVVGFDEDCRPTQDHRYRRWRTAVVESAEPVVRPSYRVKMSDGSELVSSQEHRWLCHTSGKTDWLRTDQLRTAGMTIEQRLEQREQIREEYALARGDSGRAERGAGTGQVAIAQRHGVSQTTVWRVVGDLLAGPRSAPPSRIVKPFEPWEEEDSWGAGFLAAAFDGEGHIAKNGRGLGFGQRDNEMAAQVERELDSRGFDYAYSQDESGCRKYSVKGGRAAVARFLGMFRPPRLLAKLGTPNEWGSFFGTMTAPEVVETEFVGEQILIALKTSTGTFIADGFASHNSAQRPSAEYHLGIAVGMGVKVYIPPSSDLLHAGTLYGIEDDSWLHARMDTREKELVGQMAQLHEQVNQGHLRLSQLQGALEATRYFKTVATSPRGVREAGDAGGVSLPVEPTGEQAHEG